MPSFRAAAGLPDPAPPSTWNAFLTEYFLSKKRRNCKFQVRHLNLIVVRYQLIRSMRFLKFGDVSKANALVKSIADVTPLTPKGRTQGRGRPKRKRGDPRDSVARIDIVSERLCDDVIKYLAPTLEQHKRCTLIDLQPGACLFSSKIHDFLQPKCHLLVEPEDHYYEPFIKPLLDKPASTYRYSQLNIAHSSSYWTEFQRIQGDPNLLPPRPPLPDDDPRRRHFDPSVLFIGNLAREPRIRTKGHKVPQAPLMLYQLGHHALANQFFHNAGLIRMLLWLPETYKYAAISNLPWLRSPFSVGLSMGLNISQAVSVQSVDSIYMSRSKGAFNRRTRAALLDNLNNQQVEERMRKAGMSAPQGRELQPLDVAENDDYKSAMSISPFTLNIKSVAELLTKIETTSSRVQRMFSMIRQKPPTDMDILFETLEYPQVVIAVEDYCKIMSQQVTPSRIVVLLDLALRMINIEANYQELEQNSPMTKDLEDVRTRILALSDEHSDLMSTASKATQPVVQDLLEDQISFYLSPSPLTLYQRSYESLKADPAEFWPKEDLVLFDIIPKERDLAVPGIATSEETTRFCAELLRMLFSARAQPLPQALDKIGVNAAKDLIPMVPAISDARKGGRMNPNNLRARMVTDEMVEGLVKAFFEWPFRPQSWELALANDTFEDSDNVELNEVAAA